MRILNVMLSPALGGIESAFVHYAQALQSQGHEVRCCVSPGAAVASLLPEDMKLHELPQRSQYDVRAAWRAQRLLARVQPDIILTHGRRGQCLFLLAQRLFGKLMPLVVVLHRHRFRTLSRADRVVCVSHALRAEVIAHGIAERKVEVIPNFLALSPRVLPTQHWRTPPVIGFLGRMVEEKGADIFLQSLALLKKRGVEFRAEIGGTGALKASLHAQAEERGIGDRLSWNGWVEDVSEFFARTDIFCSSSRHESFGIVLLEAFRYGKPVVATSTSGASELIRHGENGVLCAISPESLAEALERLLQDRALAFRCALRAGEDSERYTLSAVTPEIERCLHAVLEEFRSSRARAGSAATIDVISRRLMQVIFNGGIILW
jgi:glycosyltransferase involved in cell wall biosynthesis